MSDERSAHGHAWVSPRLELHALGLLAPEDEALVTNHVAGCPECQGLLAELRTSVSAWAAGGHVPASILARWPGIAPALSAVEQRQVWRHLSECASCQQDLLISTHARSSAKAPGRAPAARWAYVAVGAAATWILTWSLGRAPLPTGPIPVQSDNVVLSLVSEAPVLEDTMRGEAAHRITQVNPERMEPIALTLPPFDTPDSAMVQIEIVNQAGQVVGRLAQADSRARRGNVLLLGDSRSALPSGEYELRIVTLLRDSSADTTSLQFKVLRRP